MRRRDTEVEVENGTVLRVKTCVSARDLDAWKIVMEKREIPLSRFQCAREGRGVSAKGAGTVSRSENFVDAIAPCRVDGFRAQVN